MPVMTITHPKEDRLIKDHHILTNKATLIEVPKVIKTFNWKKKLQKHCYAIEIQYNQIVILKPQNFIC